MNSSVAYEKMQYNRKQKLILNNTREYNASEIFTGFWKFKLKKEK